MRVLHVNKFLYRRGGAESYMLDLARLQREAGDDVAFWSMQHPQNQPDPNEDVFAPRMELNPPAETWAGRAKAAAGVIYRPSARAGIEQMLHRFRPDVVHLHNIYHQLSPSILRPVARRGIPMVMTLHDYKLVCPTYQFLDHGEICEACLPRRFHQATVRRCNQGSLSGSLLATVEVSLHRALGAYDPIEVLICPSEFMRRKMLEGGIDAERLLHVPHFCDVGSIAAATEPGRGVVYGGRLSPEKGVDVLIRAMVSLPGDVTVDIAGDGPSREDLVRLAAEVGVSDRVRFLGRLATPELHQRMREAAAVVVPSRWYENQPMIILEAAAAGRPVIATELGGLPELVRPGETGWLTPHDDPAALSAAILEATSDPDRSHRLGQSARALTLARFEPARHLSELRAAYAAAAGAQSR